MQTVSAGRPEDPAVTAEVERLKGETATSKQTNVIEALRLARKRGWWTAWGFFNLLVALASIFVPLLMSFNGNVGWWYILCLVITTYSTIEFAAAGIRAGKLGKQIDDLKKPS